MSRYSTSTLRLAYGEQVVLWNQQTGRYVAISRQSNQEIAAGKSISAALQRRLHSFYLLDSSPRPPLQELYPHRSRWSILLPNSQELWHPIPSTRQADGYAYQSIRLCSEEVKLWQLCNGKQRIQDICSQLGIALENAISFLLTLTTIEVQAIQLQHHPLTQAHPRLLQLVSPRRPSYPRKNHMYDEHGSTQLTTFHRSEIQQAKGHFDNIETTLAHSLAIPHPCIENKTYGQRLFHALSACISTRNPTILEVGAGTGELAQSWLSQQSTANYIRLDLSPTLLQAQKDLLPKTQSLLGDATAIPLPDKSIDVILCNEVIADLQSVAFHSTSKSTLHTYLQKYNIQAQNRIYNLGAWQFIEEIERLLSSDGIAYISEFGSQDEIPEEATHLNHPEISIHFGDLLTVAKALGLYCRLLPLTQLLRMDTKQPWIARHSYEGLRAKLRSEGRELAARAWTKPTLDLPWPAEGIEYWSMENPGPAPLPQRVQALLIAKKLSALQTLETG